MHKSLLDYAGCYVCVYSGEQYEYETNRTDTIRHFVFPAAEAYSAEFIPLGMLPDADQSSAFGISPDGRFVVGRSGGESYRWSRDDGMVYIAEYNTADDVSADGSIVVGGDGDTIAYRWENGAVSIIGDLTTIGRTDESPGGTSMCSAHGISADGSVIVGNTAVDANGESDSFRIVDGQIEPIGDFPGGLHLSGVRSVSADGSVVVGYGTTEEGREAMRWENGMLESLGHLDGGELFSWAVKISADANAIVGRSDSAEGMQAFRWTRESGMVGIGFFPGETTDSRAWDVSGDGSVVVGIANYDQGVPNSATRSYGMNDRDAYLQNVLVEEYGLGDALSGWTLI